MSLVFRHYLKTLRELLGWPATNRCGDGYRGINCFPTSQTTRGCGLSSILCCRLIIVFFFQVRYISNDGSKPIETVAYTEKELR